MVIVPRLPDIVLLNRLQSSAKIDGNLTSYDNLNIRELRNETCSGNDLELDCRLRQYQRTTLLEPVPDILSSVLKD